MKVVMAEGKNLKKISVVIKDGQVKPGTIEDHMGHNVGTAPRANRVSEAVEESTEGTPKKICLGCSSPAMEGKDYCSSCIVFIK